MINKSIIRIVTVTILFCSTSHAGMVTFTDYNASKEAAGDVHVIDFEDAGPPRSTMSASSNGFTFVTSGDPFFIFPPDGSGASKNGTITLFTNRAGTITMFREDGGVFSLLNADFGEGNPDVPTTSILVTGFFDGVESISVTELLDGIQPQFEPITFSGFTNLTSVTFDGDSDFGFSLDNIVVPEPGTLVLMVVGASLIVRRKR